MTAFLTACAVLSGLQLLLSRTSWGRKVRATADDLDTARLVGIRVRAGVFLLVRRTFGLDARAVGSDPVAAASAGVRVGRIRRLAYFVAAGGAGAVGALIVLQTLYVEPTTVFSIQYSVDMLFMVLIGGMGTIGPGARRAGAVRTAGGAVFLRRVVPGHRGWPGRGRDPGLVARAVGIRRRTVRLVASPGRLPDASAARMTAHRPLG